MESLPMSHDEYRGVPANEHTLQVYPSGVRAGARIRLTRDLHMKDHKGRPTGEVHPSGETWTVLLGHPAEPDVVWLRAADGRTHTWNDADLTKWFEVLG
jgi:hypothetical protein